MMVVEFDVDVLTALANCATGDVLDDAISLI
jgi:hypothetical protein